MENVSQIDAAIIRVYRESHYHVAGDAPTTLLIDVFSQDLQRIHQLAHVEESVFLTACNPRSHLLDAESNAQRQQQLAQALEARKISYLNASGAHPYNGWPAEPSFLALGLSVEDATVLCKQFDQNALVWAGANAILRLILLR